MWQQRSSLSTVDMSGFTGAGYLKAVPMAVVRRIGAAEAAGDPFAIKVWTGSDRCA
jgi:succinyl-CoA:acetate CoA-transferase